MRSANCPPPGGGPSFLALQRHDIPPCEGLALISQFSQSIQEPHRLAIRSKIIKPKQQDYSVSFGLKAFGKVAFTAWL